MRQAAGLGPVAVEGDELVAAVAIDADAVLGQGLALGDLLYLTALAYNFVRVVNIVGVATLLKAV